MSGKTTKELMLRVLVMESPELFDGTDDAPVEVTDWYYHEWVPEVCETCGDDPETLIISYRTRKGEEYGETYWDFGLPQVLEALDKWDEKYGRLKNMEDA